MQLPGPRDRMTPLRKAQVINAIRAGWISRETAQRRYALSDEELASWEARYARHGEAGLSITKLQTVGRGPAA